MISYNIVIDDDGLKNRLIKFPKDRVEVNRKILKQVGLVVVGAAQRNLRGGNPLNVITGRLWNSIFSRIEKDSVWVGTNVFYGRLHETGKTLAGEKVIRPKRKKFLYIPLTWSARRWEPGLVFGEDYVLAKSAKIKKRPWLRPAINKVLKEGAQVRIGSNVYKAYFEKNRLR